MERNREGRRAAATTGGVVTSASRRPRVKDTSDDEDRLDDTVDSRVWDRSKKERLATFHVSSASMNPRNKRKRQVLTQESQVPGGRLNAAVEDADESVEETEAQASEDDDEPPPPPFLRRPGKSRVHAKEDELVMDIPAVPRKARSSMSASSRYSSMPRRQPEPQPLPQPPDFPRQKAGAASQSPLNGSSSPNCLPKQGKKLKPVAPKVRALKVAKVTETSTLSDQEAEVAEALFDLARSMPSHSGMMESKVEVKLESEAKTGSPSTGPLSMGGPSSHVSGLHHPGSTTNGYIASHLKDMHALTVEAPKRKRPRVVVKPEDGKVSQPVRVVTSGAASSSASPSMPSHSCVGETESDSLAGKTPADLGGVLPDLTKVKGATNATYSAVTDEKKFGLLEPEGMEQGEFKAPKLESQSTADKGEMLSDRVGENADGVDVLKENEGPSKGELANRSADALREDGSISKFNIDLMASPLKQYSVEDDASGLANDKQNMGDNSSIISAGYNLVDDQSKQSLVLEDAVRAMDVARGLPKLKEKLGGEKQAANEDAEQQMYDHVQKELTASHAGRAEEERGKESSPKLSSRPQEEVSENVAAPPFVSSALPTAVSSNAPVALAGWMGGLPQLGYYGPGASPWAAGASLPNPGLDVKAAHTTMQLPHGPILTPVPRMKRCATHVFVAHFIYREQQLSRHSLWSAALCRAAPYNLNIPPVNILDNDKLGGHYLDAARKASAQQSGPTYGYTISQAGGSGIAGNGSSGATGSMPVPNHTTNAGASGDTGSATGTGTASSNLMAAHAQYVQAMMQQNGFASFPFPFNGPPSQAAQFFNSHFFPPHLIPPPLPHLQPLPQQSGNVLPVPKQQQGVGSLPHSSSSQLGLPPLQQQQLQLQLAPQSPSQSQQQHNHVGISAQQFAMHADKESTAVADSASTAESRLNTMQRNMPAQQGPSNLPNLNIGASSLILGTNITGLSAHDQEGTSIVPSGVKQSGKGQQQFQGQNPTAALSSSMQPQQFTAGSGPGLQINSLPQGYSAIARGSVSSSSLGLVSVSSMMGTAGLGVLPGSVDNSKGPGQQPVYGGHAQQFQRSMTKAPPASEDAYAAKVRDYADDKKISMKAVGGPPLLSRVDMEVSSPSLQGSPTSASGPSGSRLTGGLGRALNSATPPEARSARPASSSGSGQAPLLQSQPPKQGMGRAKTASSTANIAATPAAHSIAAYSERVLPGNLSKFQGPGLPFSGQMAPSSQSTKPVHAGVAKVGQRMSPAPAQQQMPSAAMAKSHAQQTRCNQTGVPSTPPRMVSSVTAPILSAGTLPMSTSHPLSVSKASTVSTSKSPSNGKGSVSVTKAGPPTKKPPVSGPAISSVVSPAPGQNLSVRAPAQQKGPASAAHAPQFQQQQSSMLTQQQRLSNKNQVYPQLQPQQGQYKQPFQTQSPYRPQLFLQQHQQQYMQQQASSQQQPVVSQHTQVPVSHHYQTNPPISTSQQCQAPQQLSHLQQQFQTVSSSQPVAGTNGLSLSSPNLTLGTAMSGNLSSSASSDGGGSRTNATKTTYSSGNPLPTGGMPEIITTAHPTVSGQASSPHGGSSPYLQLAPVKPNEQKVLPDVTGREDVINTRHLSSPSSSQAAVASNPSSS